MDVIPVIDLKGGRVVRGVAGNRARYRPIESPLVGASDPSSVANAFVNRFGFRDIYVADLDAIEGGAFAISDYRKIAATGARLLLDAGIGDAGRARRLLAETADAAVVAGVVVGLESIGRAEDLVAVADAIGTEEMRVFSLDLRAGRPWTDSSRWSDKSAAEIVAAAVGSGFRRFIVLDLADVGTHGGPSTTALCRSIRATWPGVELIAGGGVRGSEDLGELAAAGCDCALVASALHDGQLTAADVEATRSIRHSRTAKST